MRVDHQHDPPAGIKKVDIDFVVNVGGTDQTVTLTFENVTPCTIHAGHRFLSIRHIAFKGTPSAQHQLAAIIAHNPLAFYNRIRGPLDLPPPDGDVPPTYNWWVPAQTSLEAQVDYMNDIPTLAAMPVCASMVCTIDPVTGKPIDCQVAICPHQ